MPTRRIQLLWYRRSTENIGERRLLIFFHGWCGMAILWKPFLKALTKDPDFADFDIVVVRYGSSPFSNLRISTVVECSASLLNAARVDAYQSVTLAGFSIGGLIARLFWLNAHGLNSLAAAPQKVSWASKIQHIVLLASPNRGSTVPARYLWAKVGQSFLEATGLGKQILDCVQGATAVTNLRIEWIRAADAGLVKLPMVTQVLAPDDMWVQAAESADVTLRSNGRIEVVGSGGHAGVLLTGPKHQQSFAVVKSAILGTTDPALFLRDATSGNKQLVLVRHGIRTAGRWVDQFVDGLDTTSKSTVGFDASRYGYFTALDFILPWSRSKQLAHFCDAYTEHMSQHPNAQFHFVGHSFGTWLLGAALRGCPAMRFQAVAVAGSVLPADYPWLACRRAGQVAAVRSDCATHDYPVGVVCCLLASTPLVAKRVFPVLGTGGSEGFYDRDDLIRSNRFLKGGHSVAVNDSGNLASIAAWVLQWCNGEPARPMGSPIPASNQNGQLIELFPRFAALGLPGLVVGWLCVALVTGYMFGVIAGAVAAIVVAILVLLILQVL